MYIYFAFSVGGAVIIQNSIKDSYLLNALYCVKSADLISFSEIYCLATRWAKEVCVCFSVFCIKYICHNTTPDTEFLI